MDNTEAKEAGLLLVSPFVVVSLMFAFVGRSAWWGFNLRYFVRLVGWLSMIMLPWILIASALKCFFAGSRLWRRLLSGVIATVVVSVALTIPAEIKCAVEEHSFKRKVESLGVTELDQYRAFPNRSEGMCYRDGEFFVAD